MEIDSHDDYQHVIKPDPKERVMNTMIMIAILLSIVVVLTITICARRENKEIPYLTLIKMDMVKSARPKKMKARIDTSELGLRTRRQISPPDLPRN